VFHEDGSVAEW